MYSMCFKNITKQHIL